MLLRMGTCRSAHACWCTRVWVSWMWVWGCGTGKPLIRAAVHGHLQVSASKELPHGGARDVTLDFDTGAQPWDPCGSTAVVGAGHPWLCKATLLLGSQHRTPIAVRPVCFKT